MMAAGILGSLAFASCFTPWIRDLKTVFKMFFPFSVLLSCHSRLPPQILIFQGSGTVLGKMLMPFPPYYCFCSVLCFHL